MYDLKQTVTDLNTDITRLLNSLSLRKVLLHVSSVADFLLYLYLIAKRTHMLWRLVFHIQIHCNFSALIVMNGSVTAGGCWWLSR